MSVELEWVVGGDRDARAYLEPDDDEVPEADHAELGGRVPDPRFLVLDRDDVHEVQDEFERHDTHDEAHEVAQRRSPAHPKRPF